MIEIIDKSYLSGNKINSSDKFVNLFIEGKIFKELFSNITNPFDFICNLFIALILFIMHLGYSIFLAVLEERIILRRWSKYLIFDITTRGLILNKKRKINIIIFAVLVFLVFFNYKPLLNKIMDFLKELLKRIN